MAGALYEKTVKNLLQFAQAALTFGFALINFFVIHSI